MAEGGSGAKRHEQVREQILAAARQLVMKGGISALSLRALAARVGYSPAAVYLYVRDKEELVGEVIRDGFSTLDDRFRVCLRALPEDATADEGMAALREAYVRFALENTAVYRLMFEVPGVPTLTRPPTAPGYEALVEKPAWMRARSLVRATIPGDAAVTEDDAVVGGWALLHGLTSLFLAGHLTGLVHEPGELLELADHIGGLLRRGLESERGELTQGEIEP